MGLRRMALVSPRERAVLECLVRGGWRRALSSTLCEFPKGMGCGGRTILKRPLHEIAPVNRGGCRGNRESREVG